VREAGRGGTRHIEKKNNNRMMKIERVPSAKANSARKEGEGKKISKTCRYRKSHQLRKRKRKTIGALNAPAQGLRAQPNLDGGRFVARRERKKRFEERLTKKKRRRRKKNLSSLKGFPALFREADGFKEGSKGRRRRGSERGSSSHERKSASSRASARGEEGEKQNPRV